MDKNENKIDMRNIFGYLNQNDWTTNLSMGNVMQISPLTMK